MSNETKEFNGTPKTDANWAINLNNPKQTLIENVCIIDEGWNIPGVKEGAYLIAAAPELLEALQDLMKFTVNHIDVADCQEYNHAYRIINKALGV